MKDTNCTNKKKKIMQGESARDSGLVVTKK